MIRSWYREQVPIVFGALHSKETGLTASEAAMRLKEDGPNTLPESKPDGLALIFLRQFQSPLIYILLGAGIVVFIMGEPVDGSIILAVLFFNAVVGTAQEGKAQNTLRALKKYSETTATTLRDTKELMVPDREVVRGDVVLLQEGEKVPADARVVSVRGLRVDESSLTGESEPVSKVIEPLLADGLSSAEQRNMLFKGTHIVSGNGTAVVVATGLDTAIGKIAKEISLIDSEIPLKANIRHLSRIIIVVVLMLGVFIFVLGLVRGQDIVTIFTTVVSLTVSVIPEGLPTVITLVLATGVWSMSKRNALVKRLQAVEALGQASIIAVDKTGTITKNELVVREVWTDGKVFKIGGVGYEPSGTVEYGGAVIDAANHPELLFVGKMAAFCASAHVAYSKSEGRWLVTGDPTEAAIRVFGEKVGFNKDELMHESPLVGEIPFDYRLKYHATSYRVGKKNLLVVEGAPEAVLALCTKVRRGGKSLLLRKKDREEFLTVLTEMSSRGLRVVAGAVRDGVSEELGQESVRDLTFVSFFGMQDVLRPEIVSAMERATAAGIRVVMITGDHKLTARAIAKEADIWHIDDEVLTGEEMASMSDIEFGSKISKVSVFARVTPEDKLRIINAYKKRGEIIAMTGDGVNDAPSLVAADLGVAMGKIGTEVAKEAADIVLLDDNFGSIVSAVEEGRSIYKTIKKVVLYLFSTSVGEVFTIVGALLIGYPLPLLASQIIWLNFVTDGFLTVALAMEPKERGLLSGKFERPKKYIVDGLMVRRMIFMALPMMFGTLFLFQAHFESDLSKAWTISLTTLAVFQWFNAWNCRSESRSIFKSGFFTNKYLLVATALVVVLQLLAVYHPVLQGILRTVPLNLYDWAVILPVAFTIVIVEEARKFFYHKRA